MERQTSRTCAYVSLGSNLGDREGNLRAALQKLDAHPAITVTGVSTFYETAPWGETDQPLFINAAAALSTDLTPGELLNAVKGIEVAVGRTPGPRWGPRLLDIDILLYGDQGEVTVDEPGLTIPHPRMLEREFVMLPLQELAPNLLERLKGGG